MTVRFGPTVIRVINRRIWSLVTRVQEVHHFVAETWHRGRIGLKASH
jgi:hypothetical protein